MLPNVFERLYHLESPQKTWTKEDKNHFLSHVWNQRRAAMSGGKMMILVADVGLTKEHSDCRWEAVTGEAGLSDPQTVGSRRGWTLGDLSIFVWWVLSDSWVTVTGVDTVSRDHRFKESYLIRKRGNFFTHRRKYLMWSWAVVLCTRKPPIWRGHWKKY